MSDQDYLDKAVEAATQAWYDDLMVKYGGEPAWKTLSEDAKGHWLCDRRESIEIAAPFIRAQEQERLAHGGEPDISPGDVIAAEPDGTITLDDGITTWNPSRACAFLVKSEQERLEAALLENYGRGGERLRRFRLGIEYDEDGFEVKRQPLPDYLCSADMIAALGCIKDVLASLPSQSEETNS